MPRPRVLSPGASRTVLAAVARAKAAVPAAESRIDTAAALLAGAVELLEEGRTARVGSPTDGGPVYVVNGQCSCPDFPTAPGHLCTHRLAYGIAKRATELLQAPPTPLTAPSDQGAPGAPDALAARPAEEADGETELPPEQCDSRPAAGDRAPAQYLQLIDGKPFVKYAGLLTMAHAQGLQQLDAWFTGVSDTLAVAHATATFRDGRRFSESGEATPENVGRQVRPLARLALTGPRPAVSGMPSILPCVRSRNWGVRGRRAAARSRPGPGVRAPPWHEARTPAPQPHTDDLGMVVKPRWPASLMCRALPARLRPTSCRRSQERRGRRRGCLIRASHGFPVHARDATIFTAKGVSCP